MSSLDRQSMSELSLHRVVIISISCCYDAGMRKEKPSFFQRIVWVWDMRRMRMDRAVKKGKISLFIAAGAAQLSAPVSETRRWRNKSTIQRYSMNGGKMFSVLCFDAFTWVQHLFDIWTTQKQSCASTAPSCVCFCVYGKHHIVRNYLWKFCTWENSSSFRHRNVLISLCWSFICVYFR